MSEPLLFTDPDGDGVGDWAAASAGGGGSTGDPASKAYVDAKIAALLASPTFTALATTASVDAKIAALSDSSLHVVSVTGGQVLRGYTPGSTLPTAGMQENDTAFVYTEPAP